jgi:hypothetical protein
MTTYNLFGASEIDFDKLKQVLYYLIYKIGGKPNIGKTVLFKILYYSDFDYYEKYKTFLIGEQYQKIAFGPAPVHFNKIISILKEEGKVVPIRSKYFERDQDKFIATSQEPELSRLSGNELEFINSEIKRYESFNATEMSCLSHSDMPYIATKMNELIDYRLVFYRDIMEREETA